ncbi:glycosyltransferase [Parachaetomium inaequale]|uniref:Glycosyltransferase n=1 Tax=Parachaetomium inaequale TaxID=2588326 RepID=A0AAN6PJK7_9PEZI|nr:glycosyltransferase [Parachaetomium inaequale]
MAFRSLVNVASMLAIVVALHHGITWLAAADSYLYWFFALFAWRYLRFVVNLVAFWCYSPAPKPTNPTYTPSKDVTAVIPTVGPESEGFRETLKSCAENGPAKIIVVTAGDELYAKAYSYITKFMKEYPAIEFVVERTQVVSKRAQVALAVAHIKTDIAVLLDDHVFWGPRYLESLLSAFENPAVGMVGTNKRVRREQGLGLWGRIWNMLGATYLCRHNFEIRASNAVDGGVFVVSGRTCGIRTEILRHPEFLPGYTNEKFFFGFFGPLNADDDNYNTRFAVRHGWQIKIQYTEDSVMHTTLGVEEPLLTKFLGQCRRWARTTWRSNPCSLITDRSVWAFQPYCVYAVYLTSLTNFAAVTDSLLVYLLTKSSAYTSITLAGLVSWILFTKTVKVFDYFRRHPQDIILFPVYLAFAYFHSFIKFWTLLTFYDCTWSGRRLDQIKVKDSDTKDRGTSPIRASPRAQVDHKHITTLRSIRTRIADLHSQHAQHIEGYQQPLLSELEHLRESFSTLQADHQAIFSNQEAIQTELGQVDAQAKELAATQTIAKTTETNIVQAILGVKNAVSIVEEQWKNWVMELLAKSTSIEDEDEAVVLPSEA